MNRESILFALFLVLCAGCTGKQQKVNTVEVTQVTVESLEKAEKLNLFEKSSENRYFLAERGGDTYYTGTLSDRTVFAYDYKDALYRIGPAHWVGFFFMSDTPRARPLLKYFPPDSMRVIREITWHESIDVNVSVWYHNNAGRWKPIHYKRWESDWKWSYEPPVDKSRLPASPDSLLNCN